MTYTTRQAAALLGVSRMTVSAMIDSGRLIGARIGGRRRIAQDDLLAYARQQGMPRLVRRLVLAGDRVVVFSTTFSVVQACKTREDVLPVDCWYDLAMALTRGRPRGVVFDLAIGRRECVRAAERLREEPDRPCVIALCYDSEPGPWDEVIQSDQLYRLAEVLSVCERR